MASAKSVSTPSRTTGSAPAPASTPKTEPKSSTPRHPYIVTGRVHHDGKLYTKGKTVHLTDEEATAPLKHNDVLAVESGTTASDVNTAIGLRSITREQLVQHAEEYQLQFDPDMTTGQLLDLIDEYRGRQPLPDTDGKSAADTAKV